MNRAVSGVALAFLFVHVPAAAQGFMMGRNILMRALDVDGDGRLSPAERVNAPIA